VRRMNSEKKHKDKWKRSFFAILFINIGILLLLVTLIFWPVEHRETPTTKEHFTSESSEFIIRTTKKNLNELVNAYMYEYLKNSEHQYRVLLEDDVELIGELPVFSTTVPISIHFEPFVQKNGDVILKQTSISLGLLELPNQKVMEYMEKYLPTPKWITINPKGEEIYVAVTDMDIKSNFHVSVERLDLEGNNLAFKIKVPYESLGIETLLRK
jgi:uncharacterized protein YpmS